MTADKNCTPAGSTVDDQNDPRHQQPGATQSDPSLRLRKESIWAAINQPGRAPEERLGRFRVLGRLGSGGMGVVFKAYDDTLERNVALKLLHRTDDERHRARLLREAQALARVSHPNVVQVYEVGELSERRLFIAMELVVGKTLNDWQLRRHPWPTCLELYRQAGRGLAEAHSQDLVHRDFKPANCIVDDSGRVKVLDFGLVRSLEVPSANADLTPQERSDTEVSARRGTLGTSLTETGAMMGTLAYMAPEQLRGHAAGPHSDQFSLCAALYEALHGTRPFLGSSSSRILYAIEQREWAPPEPVPHLPAIPQWLTRAVQRGLSADPADRFGSIEALLEALEPRRKRWPWLAGSAGLVGLVGLAATLVPTEPPPCEGLRDAVVPGWNEDDAQAIHNALQRVAPARADATHARLKTDIDDWTARLTDARAQTCEQTRRYESASEDLLEQRNACLDRQQQRLAALVAVLSRADAPAAAHAVQAVRALPAPEHCLDAAQVRVGPRALPPALEADAAEIRDQLSRSWASGVAGQAAEGLALAQQAVEHAAALGPTAEALHAESLYERGKLYRATRRLDEARQDLETALRTAERIDDQSLAVSVLRELVGVATNDHDRSAADAWRTALSGKLERFADDPRMEAEIAYLRGLELLRAKEYTAAEDTLRRAVQAYAALGPSAVVERLHAELRLAWAIDGQGRADEAQATHERSLTLARDEGLLLMEALLHEELSEFHLSHGHLEEAEHHGRAAIDGRSEVYGRHAPVNADALRSLAELLRRQGRIDEAIVLAEDARRSLDSSSSPSKHARVHQLAASLHRQRSDWDSALGSYRSAREQLLRMQPPDDLALAMLDSNVADCQMMNGQLDEADAGYTRSLAALSAHAEPDDPRRVFPLLGQAHLRAERGQLDAALPLYRDAWTIQRELGNNPQLHAVVQWELGRTLIDARPPAEEHAEGLALVRDARQAFDSAGATEMVDQIDQWREACGRRCTK